MMRSTVVRQEVAVGAFLCAAVAIVGIGAVIKTRERGFIGATTFRFNAAHGSGLQPGAPVLVQGVQVGEVADIQLTSDNRVAVTCQIAPRFAGHLRRDAVATIVEPPLLGSTKVEVTPGTASEPVASEQEVTGGRQGSLSDQLTTVQAKVDEVVAKVDRFVTQANDTLGAVDRVVARVDRGEGLLGKLVADPQLAEDTTQLVSRLARVAEEIDRGEGVIGMAVKDADFARDLRSSATSVATIVSGLENGEGALGRLLKDDALVVEATGLVQDARGALARLDELNAQTQRGLARVETLLETTNAAVTDVRGTLHNADRVSAELADTLHRVNQGEGTIAAFLNDDAVYRETRSLLKELRESVEDLREQAPINSFIGVVFSAF